MLNTEKINTVLSSLKKEPSERYENETLEFKGYISQTAFYNKSQDVACELCAFANKSGGTLIVGVKDSSDVKGQDWESQLMGFDVLDCMEVEKRIKGNLRPSVNLSVVNHTFEEKNYLVISIPQYRNGLVMTASGKSYIRSGRDSNPMLPQEVTDKIKSLQGYDWSSEILDAVCVDDALDEQQIEEAMAEYQSLKELGEVSVPQEHFLEKIGVTRNGLLTRGGLLFLGKTEVIQSFIGNIEYRFSKRCKGGTLPINDVWSGSLWSAITKIRGLLKQVIEYYEFTYNDKVYRFPNLCKKAFEEALINSLIHRDYTLDGLTSVDITDEVVIVRNPGEFYGGITTANIFIHPPRHRNPSLASIMMNFELVDRAGMGTRRMNIESLRLGREKTKFTSDNFHVSAVLELGSIKEGVFVIASPYEDYDVAELFLINLLYGKGYEEISSVLQKISVLVTDPRREVLLAVERMPCLSLTGNKNGIFISVDDSYRNLLRAHRKVRAYQSSENYILIFKYLCDNGKATSNELCESLNIGSLSKTQRLLRSAGYIEKVQDNSETFWKLCEN